MPTLAIDLQDGFQDEAIRVEVNGRVVLDETGVNTRLQIGFAGSHKVEVEEGAQMILVVLPILAQKNSMGRHSGCYTRELIRLTNQSWKSY